MNECASSNVMRSRITIRHHFVGKVEKLDSHAAGLAGLAYLLGLAKEREYHQCLKWKVSSGQS